MKKRPFVTLLAMLLMQALAIAGDPSVIIQGKAVVSAGSDVILDASGSVTDSPEGIIWAFEKDSRLVYGFATPEGGVPNAWCGLRNVQPGDYAITAIASGSLTGGKTKTVGVTHRLRVVSGPTPDPGPGPPPPPPPDPPPTPKPAGILHATMIYAENDYSTNVLAAKANQSIRDELKKADAYWHTFDSDQPIVKSTFGNLKYSPPCLIVTTADGKVVANQPLPETPQKIIDLIRSYR